MRKKERRKKVYFECLSKLKPAAGVSYIISVFQLKKIWYTINPSSYLIRWRPINNKNWCM